MVFRKIIVQNFKMCYNEQKIESVDRQFDDGRGTVYMLDSQRSAISFADAIDELINAKYILADGKVGEVLKMVAQSRILYELFEFVTDGYDYNAAKSVCFIDGGGFTLPQKDRDVLAFCFLLLMEIDSKREDLGRVCERYFPSVDGLQRSYEAFCAKVLIPFKEVASRTLARMIEGDATQVEEKKVESEELESPISANDSDVDSDDDEEETAVSVALAAVAREKEKRGGEACEELEFILGKLSDAIKSVDYGEISLAYIALKYALKVIKKPKIDLKSIEEEISNL